AAVIIGAQVVKDAATAGPAAGGYIGDTAMGQSEAAQPTPPSAPSSPVTGLPQTVFIPSSSTPPPEPPPTPPVKA
ncbi:MAG: conjugal transfer protein TrbL, partial [Propionibacteriaceae bacterium]|nr:conjugal transfer protein TrbL [Propionibacteriaceae bacterium]